MEVAPAMDASVKVDDLENATIEEIEAQKAKLVESGRERSLAPEVVMPTPLKKCIGAMRHTCIFKALVARNPDTSLNELHLAQPLLLLLIAAGLAVLPVTSVVVSNIHVPTIIETLAVVALSSFTSLGLTIVGFIARAIPSQEDLNKDLKDQTTKLGVSTDGVEKAADGATELEKKMRLSWVSARRETRDATLALHAAYLRDVQLDAQIHFKVKLLEYLSSGETNRAARQKKKLEDEFVNNYAEMAKLYENPLAELNRKKCMFSPNGRLSRDELLEVVKEVDQTETAAEGSYQFLGNLIKFVLEKDFDAHLANRKPSAYNIEGEVSYSELVWLLLKRAEEPGGAFRESYLRAFCLDVKGGQTAAPVANEPAVTRSPRASMYPSPPPSPPMAQTVTKAVGAFVLLEMYKDVLLRKVWLLGIGCLATSSVLLTISFTLPASAEASGSVQARLAFMIASFVQLGAAVVGWWTCNNKKDDLNQMRSIAEMKGHVQRLEKAEGRLRGALDAMAISGAEMDTLDAEIEEAFKVAQEDHERIRAEHKRRRESTKAHTLTNVLMKFVNMDDRPYWYDQQELQKLHSMIDAMTGEPDTPLEIQMHEGLRRILLAETLVPSEKYLKDAVPPLLYDQLPGNQVLDILIEHKAFEMIVNLPLNDNDEEVEAASSKSPSPTGARKGAQYEPPSAHLVAESAPATLDTIQIVTHKA